MTERGAPIEIDHGSGGKVWAMTFTANGEYIVNSDDQGVQMWRARDGSRMATMKALKVRCLAVSEDDRWIAAGTAAGEAVVWDTKTYEIAFEHQCSVFLHGVDFSPDSSQLLVASEECTATVWDLATGERVKTFQHDSPLNAAKYSPQGNQIATATRKSVRVYDSNDGRLLGDYPVKVTLDCNRGLVWLSNSRFFVVSGSTIHELDASTGSAVAEWPVSDHDDCSGVALPQHSRFVACAAGRTVTLWDNSTHTRRGLIQHSSDIRAIGFSPDDQFLAVCKLDGIITIQSLSRITVSIPLSCVYPTFQEPDIQIDDTALESWKRDQLRHADALMTGVITTAHSPIHHVLASRALVRARLQRWDTALIDAEMSLCIQPSVVGYIAKSIAYVGKGERQKGYRACDIAFERFHSSHTTFLLLVKAIIIFMAGEHSDAISRIDDLIDTVHFNLVCSLVRAHMYLILGNSRMECCDYQGAANLFEHAVRSLQHAPARMSHTTTRSLLVVSLMFGWKFDGLDIMVHQRFCEALYAGGRAKEAIESLLKMAHTTGEVAKGLPVVAEWVSDFAHRCLSSTLVDGDTVAKTAQHNNTMVLSRAALHSPIHILLLKEWARAILLGNSWKDALDSAANFVVPKFTIYQAICDRLETMDCIIDAGQCFRQLVGGLEVHSAPDDRHPDWFLGFRDRCSEKLENRGDAAMSSEQYNEAVLSYSVALSLNPVTPECLFIKRSKAYIAKGSWKEALDDANKVIELDPSSPWGYERKHAILHHAGDYENATSAFKTMLFRMSQSSDPQIRGLHPQYVNPGDTATAIRRSVQDAIRDSPRVLINTMSGRLFDKSEQAASFESLPVFNELISSMTTHIDQALIWQEVIQHYRYAMLSHKWEENEPLFEEVVRIVVYDLDESLTHDKLRMFCKIVRDRGLHWAWSDTCCINKADHFVLTEALVSMFKWYQGSTETIVLLRGVRSPSRRGDLVRSIWNTRAWTFQEYHASRVVRFYNEDWTLYMNLDIPNHKESPEILSEMEEVTGISPRALMSIRPGLDDIREKFCLASPRQTTLVEDAAYSLLGIFSISLPVVYGEGDQALGRLLAQLLSSSGDTNIFAWTGKSGGFNSCLPANIAVFNQLSPPHIPPALPDAELETITTQLRASSLGLTSITKLYDQLVDLHVPSLSGKRITLPCIVFKLGPLLVSQSTLERIFRAQTDALGIVEIQTEEDLSRCHSLYLVHPWVDFLLDRQPVGSVFETIPEENADDQSASIDAQPWFHVPSSTPAPALHTWPVRLSSRFWLSFGGTSRRRSFQPPPNTSALRRRQPSVAESLRPPSSLSESDREIRALRVIARLRQPFGALLLTPTSVAAYRRVAAESLITVQVEEITPTILHRLVNSVHALDVL